MNIRDVYEMLKGEHASQNKATIGYEKVLPVIKRQPGDIWTEVSPTGETIIWEQKKGYRIKKSKHADVTKEIRDYLTDYPNCYADCEKRKTKNYTEIDKDTRKIHGMCLECLAKKETLLKISGGFEEYERGKKIQSLKDQWSAVKVELSAEMAKNRNIDIANEDGTLETFAFENKDEFFKNLGIKIDNYFEAALKDLETQ